MIRTRFLAFTFAAALAGHAPLGAQSGPAAPASAVPTPSAPEPVVASDAAVDAYYASRNEAPIWLKDVVTRAAAQKLPEFLRRAPLDGLAEGPELAASVEAAIARGQPADDRLISSAWVKYVQALREPVDGIGYGDPALAPKFPSASDVLGAAAEALSLAAHVERISTVNPLYSALREQAAKDGAQGDPRVRATLDRLRIVRRKGRAILVDAASAELWMLEDGRPVDSMKVIVGKKDFPTPLLAGTIHYVTFNPYWHIPQDVARRKVAPIVLKRGTGYLKLARYETVSRFGEGAEPVDPDSIDWKAVAAGEIEANIRQKAGGNNMMGAMKFGFVNDHGIFLHDTPHKELFAKARRTLSLGCIRLEHPERLARWLLGRDPVAPGDGSEQLVQVDKGVPIYVTYLTAKAVDGQLAFAEDVYGLDAAPEEPKALAAVSAAQSSH